MRKYLVGGAVRDLILKRKNNDKDYVVVGLSAEEMLSLGFKSVGKSFPVFIKADLEGEYALARTEKKSGDRHFDFECFTKDVTLEEDLKRRDLTINAIAYDEEKDEFIDPFDGLKDIENKILRPVSAAFKEDALRVLRAARFRAELGFEWQFDDKLKRYAIEIKDELKFISKERIYKETKKAMRSSSKPSVFFVSLLELGVLEIVFPWAYFLTKMEHNNAYHQEDSVFIHTMMSLDLCEDENARWAVLFHDVGKYYAFLEDGNFHRHYDAKILKRVFNDVMDTISLSREELKIAEFFALNHHNLQKVFTNEMKASKIASLLFRIKTERTLESLIEASLADMNGRIGEKHALFFTKEQIKKLWRLLRNEDYGVDHQTMKAERIRSIVAGKQVFIVKEFVKNIDI